MVKVPVFANGNIILHVYRKARKSFIGREGFDAVYEPRTLRAGHRPYLPGDSAWDALRLYSCQNIEKNIRFRSPSLESAVYKRSSFAFPITDAVADVLRAKGFSGDLSICALPA